MEGTIDRPTARAPALYQRQQSAQTLAEGLAEYYALNEGVVTRPSDLPRESAELFRSHDLCHVIFGLSTSPGDEALADTRTLLSCDVGFARYADYLRTDAQAKALFAQIGFWRLIWIALAALPRILRALIEAARMSRRWPWKPPEGDLDRTLADLRSDYRIRVI
ncbi:MAG TPA: hypothetical protein VII63_09930 [Caulobacteraceae bacterium]